MSVEIWIAFVLAASLILIIPGPTIILVISHAVAHGRRTVIPLVIGVTLGDFVAMTLSLLGMGAILASSAALFSVLKWIGAAYLMYLGIKLWRSDSQGHGVKVSEPPTSGLSLLKSAFIVTALNPKSIAFFVAFLPQFVSSRHNTLPQFFILGGTFLFLAALNAGLYALFAGHLRDKLRNARIRRWFNRCGGGALVSAGIVTATLQRSS
jgi:threonine/homoserine/homoserine lactone efflux protein